MFKVQSALCTLHHHSSSVGIEFGHISLRISLNLIDRVFQFVRIDVSENQGKEFVGVFHFVSLGGC